MLIEFAISVTVALSTPRIADSPECKESRTKIIDFVLYNHRALALDLVRRDGSYLNGLVALVDRCPSANPLNVNQLASVYFVVKHPTTFALRILEMANIPSP